MATGCDYHHLHSIQNDWIIFSEFYLGKTWTKDLAWLWHKIPGLGCVKIPSLLQSFSGYGNFLDGNILCQKPKIFNSWTFWHWEICSIRFWLRKDPDSSLLFKQISSGFSLKIVPMIFHKFSDLTIEKTWKRATCYLPFLSSGVPQDQLVDHCRHPYVIPAERPHDDATDHFARAIKDIYSFHFIEVWYKIQKKISYRLIFIDADVY